MSISLCIVARNEAPFLRECIESALPVADEVVLVDTGSTDATREIGRRAGARVIQAAWPGDLARAHSLPVAYAHGDWVLSLDGDEVLDPASRHKIRDLVASPDHEGYNFTVRNYLYDAAAKWRWADPCDPLVKGAIGYFPSVAIRLFRRREPYRYSGRLHQSVAPSIIADGGRIGTADVPIHHYGHIRFDRSKSWLYGALARRQVAAEQGNARAWIDLGILLSQNLHWPAAGAAFFQARSLGERPTASFFLGGVLIEMRHSAAAIPFLNEAVRGNPRDDLPFFDRADAWELLGLAQQLIGESRAAEGAYLLALRSRPDSPVALNNLVELLGERRALREARRLAQRLIIRCRGLDMPWATLGTILLRTGDLEGARRAFETALDINPGNLPALVNLAVTHERGGRRGKAKRAYSIARERNDSQQARSLGLAEHLPRPECSRPRRLRPLGAGAAVSIIAHLAGGGGRVLVDAVHALRGRPQLVLCSDAGAYTGQELRAELEDAGVQVRTVNTVGDVYRIIEQVQPKSVIHHWWQWSWLSNAVRTGMERWIAVGHSALPMPFGYDAYVVISEFHEQFQRHLPPERLVRIPNGVRLNDFGRQTRRARQPVTIAMLSRLAPGKFPRRLLEYVAPLAGLDARVIIAGFGSRRFEIEPEISRRGLGKVVSFIGPIPNAQVHRFLREADIGLHLTETHVELCSMTILEMLASGLPIVAEPKGCLTEMIVHGDNGFLAVDEGEIAGYLRELIASPELRQRMGEASRAVAERYDFARFRASLLELVDGVPRTSIQDNRTGASGRSRGRSVRRATRTGATSGRPQMEVWRPAISYLVCATPRSGSSLLCESLTNTGLAGRPNEFFIRHTDWWSLPEWGETKDIEQYLAWLFEDCSTPNAVFGAKIMMDHFVELVEELRKLPGRARLGADARLQSVFPGLRYVWMTRRDKLRQAISRLRTDQTGRWWRHQGDLDLPVPKPRFNRKEIERRLEEIRFQEAEWQTFFDASGTEPVVVVYEDLVGSYEATAKRVAKELGIVVPRKVWFGERQLLSQSDATTDRWVERFKR